MRPHLEQALSHELGHTFGLLDANVYIKDNTGKILDVTNLPPNDIMGRGNPNTGDLKFATVHIKTLRAAVGLPLSPGYLTDALNLYKDHFNLPDQRRGLPDPEAISTQSQSALNVSGSAGDLLTGDQLDAGTVLADGPGRQTASVPLTLTNSGSGPLTISSVQLSGSPSGFSILDPNPAGQVLDIGQSVTLTVLFDPTAAGNASGTLTITTDDPNGPFTVNLTGNGLSDHGQLSVSLRQDPFTGAGINNFGGVKLGDSPLTLSPFATVTNTGGGPLTVSSVLLSRGQGEFTVSGLPVGFAGPSSSIILAPGQSVSFDVTFVPDHIGLQRGQVQIFSDDPNIPVFSQGFVGTGLPTTGTALVYAHDYVAVETPDSPGAPVLRQISDAMGNWQFFLPPETPIHYVIFDPVSGLVAHGYELTAPSGQNTSISEPVFEASTSPDTNGDGLPDDIKFAIGTSFTKADTDGDGIDDFTAIQEGLNPLGGRAFPTGQIANLSVQGEAKAIVVQGAAGGAGQTAYLATGSYGLAVVDASQFNKPIVLGELALPGDATSIGVDPTLKIAAVAGNAAGLHLVDVSDPTALRRLQTVNLAASQVVAADGIAYAGVGGNLVAVDLLTGQPLQTLTLSAGNLTGLAREGTMLYTMDSKDTLRAIDLSGLAMAARGALTLPAGGGRLFVGNGIAYVVAADFTDPNSRIPLGGYVTVNVADPDHLVLLHGPDTSAQSPAARTAFAANGSGVGLLLGTPPVGQTPPNLIEVLNTSDPNRTNNFVTSFILPAVPRDVTIASGIAYVADDSGGLAVVNYLPFDTQGQPPTAAISTSAADVDPTTPGIQVYEGSTIPIRADVSDDVQVRSVELLQDGQVVQEAVSFPFNLSAAAPRFTRPGQTTTLQLRVTDTGGDTTLSNLLTLGVVADPTPLQIVSIDPADGAVENLGFHVATIHFTKAVAASSVTPANFQILDMDASGRPIPVALSLLHDGRVVEVSFSVAPGTIRHLALVVHATVQDRAGHALGGADVTHHFTVNSFSIQFVGSPFDREFDWSDPKNWLDSKGFQRLPGPGDYVYIGPSGILVRYSAQSGSPTTSIANLVANASLELDGVSLTVTGTGQAIPGKVQAFGDLMLNSSTLTVSGPVLVNHNFGFHGGNDKSGNPVSAVGNIAGRIDVHGNLVLSRATLNAAREVQVDDHFDFYQGILSGATLVGSPSIRVSFTGGEGVWDGVKVEGDLKAGAFGTSLDDDYLRTYDDGRAPLGLVHGLTVNGSLTGFRFDVIDPNLLDGTGTLINTYIDVTGPSVILPRGAGSLTIGPHVTMRGATHLGSWDGATIINQGTLIADRPYDASSSNKSFYSTSEISMEANYTAHCGPAPVYGFVYNDGVIQVEDKARLRIFGPNGSPLFVNRRTLAVHGGPAPTEGQAPSGGTLIQEGGWSSSLTTVDAGGTILMDSLGPFMTGPDKTSEFSGPGKWLMDGIIIKGGTLDLTNGARLIGSGNLDGVTVNGNIDVSDNMTISNGVTVNGTIRLGGPPGSSFSGPDNSRFGGPFGGLNFPGPDSLAGNVTIIFAGNPTCRIAGLGLNDLIIGANITVRGGSGRITQGGRRKNLINRGTIVVDTPGDTITIENSFYPFLGGPISQPWDNEGVLEADNGGSIVVIGLPANNAPGTLSTGTWRVSGGTIQFTDLNFTAITTDAATLVLDGPNSKMLLAGGGHALANLTAIAAGGSFTIRNGFNFTSSGPFTNGGTLAIGAGSTFTATSGYTQTAAGSLSVSIGAPQTGTLPVPLNVSGQAALGGTLDVTLANGYVPKVGDQFTLLTYRSRVGQFATINGLDLGGGLALRADYNATDLTLTVVNG